MVTETSSAESTETDKASSPMSFTLGDPVPVIDAYDFFIMGAPARKTGMTAVRHGCSRQN